MSPAVLRPPRLRWARAVLTPHCSCSAPAPCAAASTGRFFHGVLARLLLFILFLLCPGVRMFNNILVLIHSSSCPLLWVKLCLWEGFDIHGFKIIITSV